MGSYIPTSMCVCMCMCMESKPSGLLTQAEALPLNDTSHFVLWG